MGETNDNKGANFRCKVCEAWHGGYPKKDVCRDCDGKGLG